jgi:transposase
MSKSGQGSAVVYGVDLGKSIFHVVGLDERGAVIQRLKFGREKILAFFEKTEQVLIGMEACPGSQWLARKLQGMEHRVRIIPAQFVKPCVKSNKNDTIDAEAIAEAATRLTMRFTQVRSTEQVDLQALHRMRDQLVTSRTRFINQARAFCIEYGIAIRQGAGLFRRDLPLILDDETNDLTPAMRRMLRQIFDDVIRLDQRIAEVTREVEALAARDDRARRLMFIPGIGPLAATALLAAVGDGRQFRRARGLAAWLGLVPREHSTGGKTALLSISKRGNRYVRHLLIHGARSYVIHLDRARDCLGS